MTTGAPDRLLGPDRATTGVVLAGGESSRFGAENKALARLEGVPLVERVVETVATATGPQPVLAVARTAQRDALRNVLGECDPVFVLDEERFAGPVAGIAAAVSVATTPWLFVCACDMPLLSSQAVSWLGSHCTADTDAVVPVVDGHRQPLHAFYRGSSVEDALSRVPTRSSLQRLLDELPACRSVPFSRSPADVDAARSVRSVNTKEELRALAAER